MNPSQPARPYSGTSDTDLLVYAGQLLETPAGLAQAVLDYAVAMARRGTAELVTLPILRDGEPHELRLLLGGAVPVGALAPSDREPARQAEDVIAQLRAGIPVPVVPAAGDEHRLDDEEYWLTAAYGEWD